MILLQSAWSQPAIYISILAPVISAALFMWNMINQGMQDKKWEHINLPNLDITEIKVIT